MAELIVVGFKNDTGRASQVLNELKILDDEWIVQLRDAVAVHRDAKGALKMDQSYQPTGWQGAGWGGALGLIIGATLAILSLPARVPPLRPERSRQQQLAAQPWAPRAEPWTPRSGRTNTASPRIS